MGLRLQPAGIRICGVVVGIARSGKSTMANIACAGGDRVVRFSERIDRVVCLGDIVRVRGSRATFADGRNCLIEYPLGEVCVDG